ncbi:headcase protein-like [Haliotis asinina]|uniref:headcase protein-like n=1 Tax=Haliotis asinina TaxID=109174 RepID=UPI0035320B1A
MPNHKHHRNHRSKEGDTNNNIEHVEANNNSHGRQPRVDNNGPRMFVCCVPSSCRNPDETIDEHDPGTAVKVFCNNENCQNGTWMHKECFDEWEQSVLSYLRSCGRARSWSERQRLQNLWTKKGYDLAFKACDCKCGRGHIRKDLNYIPMTVPVDNAKKLKKHKKKNDKPMPVVSTSHKPSHNSNSHSNHSSSNANNNNNNSNGSSSIGGSSSSSSSVSANINIINNNNSSSGSSHHTISSSPAQRIRTSSISSTGSSPPNSATSGSPLSSSPVGGGTLVVKVNGKKSDFFADHAQAAAGNIFKKRQDFSAFNIVPRVRQNPYNIKMEDEGPYGNDDVRSFVLSALSSYKLTSIPCVLCKTNLPVFDHYPLIDGTFFLSPQAYDERVVQVIWEGRIQFLNSICVCCMEGKADIKCASCKRKWNSSTYVLGTMYTYDIFAAMPCCQKRLTCKHCRRAVVDVKSGLNFFSQYSQMIICPYCKANDYHFIRPLNETYIVKQPICY